MWHCVCLHVLACVWMCVYACMRTWKQYLTQRWPPTETWKEAKPQQQQRIRTMASLIKTLLSDISSLFLFHDGTPDAHQFLGDILSAHTPTPTPIVLGDLKSPKTMRKNFQNYYTESHNDKEGLTVLLFGHFEVARNFLRHGRASWIKGILMLVNLDFEVDARWVNLLWLWLFFSNVIVIINIIFVFIIPIINKYLLFLFLSLFFLALSLLVFQ